MNISLFISIYLCTCGEQIECTGDMDQVSITDLLLEIRQYRVGLIQTPDQLRFTYLAILEGVRVLMPEIYQRAAIHHLQTNAGMSWWFIYHGKCCAFSDC